MSISIWELLQGLLGNNDRNLNLGSNIDPSDLGLLNQNQGLNLNNVPSSMQSDFVVDPSTVQQSQPQQEEPGNWFTRWLAEQIEANRQGFEKNPNIGLESKQRDRSHFMQADKPINMMEYMAKLPAQQRPQRQRKGGYVNKYVSGLLGG